MLGETVASGFVPPRPFRVNAGPVHSYHTRTTLQPHSSPSPSPNLNPNPNPNPNPNSSPNPNPNPSPSSSPKPNPNQVHAYVLMADGSTKYLSEVRRPLVLTLTLTPYDTTHPDQARHIQALTLTPTLSCPYP